ncbi:hypothetical protein LIER_44084 [Lithospermum erythrorhizon]|uniref:Uncharacterized protein n=1 Tax=Lithospermum erythrorhizon TaxID=34254 RepID=A0AAV3P8G2_LITER
MDLSDDRYLGIDPDTFPCSASIVGESFVFMSSDITDLSSTHEKSTGKSFPISPLKRQMDNVTICPVDGASPTKKQLTFDDSADQADAKVSKGVNCSSLDAPSAYQPSILDTITLHISIKICLKTN